MSTLLSTDNRTNSLLNLSQQVNDLQDKYDYIDNYIDQQIPIIQNNFDSGDKKFQSHLELLEKILNQVQTLNSTIIDQKQLIADQQQEIRLIKSLICNDNLLIEINEEEKKIDKSPFDDIL